MAGTCSPVTSHVIGSTAVELSRNVSRTGAPLSARISSRSYAVPITADAAGHDGRRRTEGPSCIFVGPVETASQETLEALYRQAREAYYSGEPLIVDDMFDRVELKLRWYGSKYVVKYPRCSLRRHSTYADAEEIRPLLSALDTKQHACRAGRSFTGFCIGKCIALDSWFSIFRLSCAYNLHCCSSLSRCVRLGNFLYQSSFCTRVSCNTQCHALHVVWFHGWLPIAFASVGALQGLWKNNLVALKGVCPDCGEEEFAFVRCVKSNHSPHRTECNVCESSLEFRTKVEQSIWRPG